MPKMTDGTRREIRRGYLTKAAELILAAVDIGDSDRPGIADTPRRFASMWEAFADYDAGTIDTTFPLSATVSDQMVVVSGMRVWSMCEHHLLPFWCDVAVGYVPKGVVLGLSKFARIAHKYAHRLQLQEQLVAQILEEIIRVTGTEDVAVYAAGEHLCMTMRGAETPHTMHSSAVRGSFHDSAATRAEFLTIAGVTRQ